MDYHKCQVCALKCSIDKIEALQLFLAPEVVPYHDKVVAIELQVVQNNPNQSKDIVAIRDVRFNIDF